MRVASHGPGELRDDSIAAAVLTAPRTLAKRHRFLTDQADELESQLDVEPSPVGCVRGRPWARWLDHRRWVAGHSRVWKYRAIASRAGAQGGHRPQVSAPPVGAGQ